MSIVYNSKPESSHRRVTGLLFPLAALTSGDFRFWFLLTTAESAKKYKMVTDGRGKYAEHKCVENAHVILKYISNKPMVGNAHCNEYSSKTAKIIVKKLRDFVSPRKLGHYNGGKETFKTSKKHKFI